MKLRCGRRLLQAHLWCQEAPARRRAHHRRLRLRDDVRRGGDGLLQAAYAASGQDRLPAPDRLRSHPRGTVYALREKGTGLWNNCVIWKPDPRTRHTIICAEASGHNDILVKGRKVSCTAQRIHKVGFCTTARCCLTPTLAWHQVLWTLTQQSISPRAAKAAHACMVWDCNIKADVVQWKYTILCDKTIFNIWKTQKKRAPFGTLNLCTHCAAGQTDDLRNSRLISRTRKTVIWSYEKNGKSQFLLSFA